LLREILFTGALQNNVDDQPNNQQNGNLNTRAHQHRATAAWSVIAAGATTIFSVSISISSVHCASL